MSGRILVNATTLVVGGGIQIGTSLMEYLERRPARATLCFALSQGVYETLSPALRSDPRVHAFRTTPARPWSGGGAARKLRELERGFGPDLIYSLGFPSYVRFKAAEVGRYTNPWEINLDIAAWPTLPIAEQLATRLRVYYRQWWARRAAYFETQTDAARDGIIARIGAAPDCVKVIPNSANPKFIAADPGPKPRGPAPARVCVFALAAGFRHKNLGIVPAVARRVRALRPDLNWQFVVTLPVDSALAADIRRASQALGVEDAVVNAGPLSMAECIEWYRRSDVVFLPTLLEVFSATYVEAMAMSRPIVTSDLDFARSVCGDAARFYDAHSADAAANAILAVVTSDTERCALIERGHRRLREFPDGDTKHAMLFAWLEELAAQHRNA